MKNLKFKISGFSTALFSTWFFIEELGILFDAGDGVSSNLLQKSRKIKNVFISHADRDHLTGLFQFNQLNAREGFPIIHYPSNCGSFPAIESFVKKFDPHVKGTIWNPIDSDFEILINKNTSVKSIRNNHVETKDGIHKSLSYKIYNKKRKLKLEFQNKTGQELKAIIQKEGSHYISKEVEECILGYSGDTPVEDYNRWDNTKILIHEATFLEDNEKVNTNKNKHSTLKEVMKMVSSINIESLILCHFSSRYSQEEIDESIKKLCKLYQIKIPVYRVLPGQVSKDILSQTPVNF